MESRRRRQIALAVVTVAFVGAAMFRLRSNAPDTAPGTASGDVRGGAQPPGGANAQSADINLRGLQAERPGLVDATRNPFSFKPKPPPPPPSRATTQPGAATPFERPEAAPPPIQLKFIGVLDSPRTGRVAILSDARGVYQGREGEIIEGRYRIVKIGVESVELVHLDGRGPQAIRLTGQ